MVIAVMAVFGALALMVVVAGPALEAIEMRWVLSVLQMRVPVWTVLIQVVTFITSAVPCAIGMALLSLVQVWRAAKSMHPLPVLAHWRQAWPGIIFAAAIASNIAVRIGVGRLPPQVEYLPVLLPEVYAGFHQFSFPSGHAGTALVTYGSVVLALWQVPFLRMRGRRWWVLLGALVIILATGFGRVYLGVHWPTDVVGGYLLAAFWMGVGDWLRPTGMTRQTSLVSETSGV